MTNKVVVVSYNYVNGMEQDRVYAVFQQPIEWQSFTVTGSHPDQTMACQVNVTMSKLKNENKHIKTLIKSCYKIISSCSGN